MLRLYGSPLSGNAYKCRLLLSLLGIEYETVNVDLQSGENRSEEFLSRNPRGQIPVLEDGDTVIWDSQAILVYLARRYGSENWLPLDAGGLAEVMQWLAVSENELLFGLARARAVIKFGRDFDLPVCQSYGRSGLQLLDQHLERQRWLAAGRPTVADVACYPYVALAHEGKVPVDEFQHVSEWMSRLGSLPGFTSMPGIDGPE